MSRLSLTPHKFFARNIQRDLVEVSTERPSLKPERMYTWIYSAKNLPADSIKGLIVEWICRLLDSKIKNSGHF